MPRLSRPHSGTRAVLRAVALEASSGDHAAVGSVEQFERFRRVVMADAELQEELRSIPDWPAFVRAAVEAAARRGIEVTEEDVLAARDESRRSWRERWV